MVDIVSGKAKLEELSEIKIDDLLGRDEISPDSQLFDKCIKNKVVLVTGAGGSIGSELCRQIIKHEPKQLVLFELSEYALYSVEQEFKTLIADNKYDIALTSLLGTVQDKMRLKNVWRNVKLNFQEKRRIQTKIKST